MRFEKETENKIREAFRQEDFQNFMFEAVFGESKDEDAEDLGGDDLDCKNIKFFAFCNHLYYIIFDIVTKPYFMKDVMDKKKNRIEIKQRIYS